MQIEIEDGRVLNIFKKHKNAAHKLTPLGMLFPASIKNDIEQISITCRELNDVKQSVTILSSKIYVLLGIIDLKKLITGTKLKDNLCGLMLRWKSKEKSVIADTFVFR